ncbi:MAG: glycosyltransferase [Bacteroidales bacterium]
MLSVIIPFYKNIPNLELLLLALQQQTFKDFEVIIAEDDNSIDTIDYLNKVRASFLFQILHVSQEDQGFRKCQILNSAIKATQGDKIVFLDGDCIPHRKFLFWHNALIKKDRFLTGRRVMLSEILSNKLLRTKELSGITLFSLFLYKCALIKRALYLPFMPEYVNS